MPILFDRFAAVADRAVDGIFGGDILIEPQASGKYTGASSVDPDRPAVTVAGTFTMTKVSEEPLAGQAGGLTRVRGLSQVDLRQTVLRLTAAVAATIGYELRGGDRITRLDRSSDNVFEVVDAVPDDRGGLIINVVNL